MRRDSQGYRSRTERPRLADHARWRTRRGQDAPGNGNGQNASSNGFGCFVGRCYERDEPFPYLPFVEIIESALAQAASLDDFPRQMGDNAAELAQMAPSLGRIFPDVPKPLELPPTQKWRYLFQSVSEALGRAAKTSVVEYP